MREVVPPRFGLLVRRGDVSRLTDVVGRLVHDTDLRATLGASCRDWVTENFSEEAVLGRLRTVYATFETARR